VLTAEDFERDRHLELERVRQLTSTVNDDIATTSAVSTAAAAAAAAEGSIFVVLI